MTILTDRDMFDFVRKRRFNITDLREENLTRNSHEVWGGSFPNPQRWRILKRVPCRGILQGRDGLLIREDRNQVQTLIIASEVERF